MLKGGRGLTGIEDTHDAECSALASYVLKSEDPLTVIMRETTSLTQKFLLKFASASKFTTLDLTVMKYVRELCAKPLHGKFFCKQDGIPQVDLEGSHRWLKCARLQCKTESFICATQEQTVVTNYIGKEIFKQNINPLCRLCGEHNKSIAHITSGCKILLDSKYKQQHDRICTYLHWGILKDHNMPISNTWYTHNPKAATEISDHITLHYGMVLDVNHGVSANQHNIIIQDSAKKCAFFIDVTVLMDIDMVKAAADKYKKYWDLEVAYKKEFYQQK
eukprot:2305196-Ditylum_brightwellii.AAC.1